MGELYDTICGWENLRLAHKKAAKGKRSKIVAAKFEYKLARSALNRRAVERYRLNPVLIKPNLLGAVP